MSTITRVREEESQTVYHRKWKGEILRTSWLARLAELWLQFKRFSKDLDSICKIESNLRHMTAIINLCLHTYEYHIFI